MHQIKLTNTDASTLGKLFVEAASFASSDDLRPILAAVKIDRDNAGNLRLIATDSYKLAVITTTIDAPEGLMLLVNAKEVAAIGKELGKLKPAFKYGNDELEQNVLSFDEGSMLAETATWTRSAGSVFGTFPNWEQVCPNDVIVPDAMFPHLSSVHLAAFTKVRFGGSASDKGFALEITTRGKLKPTTFTGSADGISFFGLLMPVRK